MGEEREPEPQGLRDQRVPTRAECWRAFWDYMWPLLDDLWQRGLIVRNEAGELEAAPRRTPSPPRSRSRERRNGYTSAEVRAWTATRGESIYPRGPAARMSRVPWNFGGGP